MNLTQIIQQVVEFVTQKVIDKISDHETRLDKLESAETSTSVAQSSLTVYPKHEYDRCLARDMKVQMDGLVMSAQEVKTASLSWQYATKSARNVGMGGQMVKIADMRTLIGATDYDAGWRLASSEFVCQTELKNYDIQAYIENHQLMLRIPKMTTKEFVNVTIAHPCFGSFVFSFSYFYIADEE